MSNSIVAPAQERGDQGHQDPVLTVRDVRLAFGAVQALDSVDLDVSRGEIVSIVGPNGSGKTSLLNSINGFYRPQSGTILVNGQSVIGRAPHLIARMGVARTFQHIHLYERMTVLDNLLTGRHIRIPGGLPRAVLRPWGLRTDAVHRRKAEDVIDFLGLQAHRLAPVGSLGYGVRKRVDLGRALIMEPELLLLDEPMAGMNVEEKEDMARFILDIQEIVGTPIILVEHDLEVVTDIANRLVVLDWGHVVASGSADEVLAQPEVITAYIGVE